MNYYLAPSLVRLRREVDARWPDRDTASDGWIGDPAHSARVSDHNPDEKGCVHALDLDTDGINVALLLREVIGDPRVWYVIHNRRIHSRTYDWASRVYTGANPHLTHVHISIRYARFAERDDSRWLGATQPRRSRGGRLPAVDLSNVLEQVRYADEANRGVRFIQAALNRRIDADLRVDGRWGADTHAAYLRYESTIDAPRADGIPGMASLSELGRGHFRVIR